MRKISLTVNAIVVVVFISVLVYTCVARSHVESLARGFVTEKTLVYSKPLVDLADEAMGSPWVKNLLSEKQETSVRQEITDYRNDPEAYIADLTRQPAVDGLAKNANPAVEKVASIKNKIRAFYDELLNALIADLRIFAISNLIAGWIAFGLAWRSSVELRQSIVWFSCLMTASVLYCSYIYIDDLTFFRILFRTHMGWWYPVFLCLMVGAIYLDYGRGEKPAEQGVEGQRANMPVVKN
jgi:hypothetical protein